MEYEAKFTELSRFVPELVSTEEKKARRFYQGLRQWIQNQIVVLELTDYATVVQKATIVESGSEQSQKEKEGKREKEEKVWEPVGKFSKWKLLAKYSEKTGISDRKRIKIQQS